jgi:hypothetical protein
VVLRLCRDQRQHLMHEQQLRKQWAEEQHTLQDVLVCRKVLDEIVGTIEQRAFHSGECACGAAFRSSSQSSSNHLYQNWNRWSIGSTQSSQVCSVSNSSAFVLGSCVGVAGCRGAARRRIERSYAGATHRSDGARANSDQRHRRRSAGRTHCSADAVPAERERVA